VLHDQFEGVHDDYAAYLELILVSQAQTKEMLKDFWKKALGTESVPWEEYSTIKTAFEPKQLEAVSGRTQHGRGRLTKTSAILESVHERDGTTALDGEHS
jgi:hypothetical protein